MYALAHDYGGCLKWILYDLPPAIARDNVPWMDPGDLRELTTGLYWYDGTLVAIENGMSPKRVIRLHLDKDGRTISKRSPRSAVASTP